MNPPQDRTSLIVKFQTANVMPPPYAYFYTLKIKQQAAGLAVDYTLTYLDRDEIDEETILEEGFTLNDDFAWKGKLGKVWQDELLRLLYNTKLVAEHKIKETDNYIELNFDEVADQGTFPSERKHWDYLLQELVQAIYESAQKELPFELEYIDIDGNRKSSLRLEASFANRELTTRVNDSEPKTRSWKQAREVMETVFQADFLMQSAEERKPEFSGKYLSVGDGLWYEFGEALVEPTPDSKVLNKIGGLLDDLMEESKL